MGNSSDTPTNNNNNNNNAPSHIDHRFAPAGPSRSTQSSSNALHTKSNAAVPSTYAHGAHDVAPGSHNTNNYSATTPTMTPNSSMYHQPNTMESAQTTQSSLNLLPSFKYYSNQHSNNSNSTHISSGSNHSNGTSSNSAFSHFTSSDVNGGNAGHGHRVKLRLQRRQSRQSHRSNSHSEGGMNSMNTSMAVQYHQFDSPISSTMATAPHPSSSCHFIMHRQYKANMMRKQNSNF